jgi:hypothetical protein
MIPVSAKPIWACSSQIASEERRQFVRIDEIADAAAMCAEDVIRIVKRLTNSVDDMANALARDGAHGLRTLMKTITDRQCTEIADAFERLAFLARSPSEGAQVPIADSCSAAKGDHNVQTRFNLFSSG